MLESANCPLKSTSGQIRTRTWFFRQSSSKLSSSDFELDAGTGKKYGYINGGEMVFLQLDKTL